MQKEPPTWLVLLGVLLWSGLTSCAVLPRPNVSAAPNCPVPSVEASDEFSEGLVWDPRYPHFNEWFGEILEYCWHEKYEETP